MRQYGTAKWPTEPQHQLWPAGSAEPGPIRVAEPRGSYRLSQTGKNPRPQRAHVPPGSPGHVSVAPRRDTSRARPTTPISGLTQEAAKATTPPRAFAHFHASAHRQQPASRARELVLRLRARRSRSRPGRPKILGPALRPSPNRRPPPISHPRWPARC
jgi:hypothetical protein